MKLNREQYQRQKTDINYEENTYQQHNIQKGWERVRERGIVNLI